MMNKKIIINFLKKAVATTLLLALFISLDTPVVNATNSSGIKSVQTYVKTYGSITKECMVDHIIIEYRTSVKLPKSVDKCKKLYSLKDTYYGGSRKIAAV